MENNYRVMIEPLNSEMEENFSDELRLLECVGFALIAEQGDGTIVAVNHMNNLGIAKAIAGNTCCTPPRGSPRDCAKPPRSRERRSR